MSTIKRRTEAEEEEQVREFVSLLIRNPELANVVKCLLTVGKDEDKEHEIQKQKEAEDGYWITYEQARKELNREASADLLLTVAEG